MSNCIFLLVPFNAYRADSEDYINVASAKITVQNTEITVLPYNDKDYISAISDNYEHFYLS